MLSMTISLFQSESALVSIIQDSLVSEGSAGRVIATRSICFCRLILNIEYHSITDEKRRSLECGFLTNGVRVVSYKVLVTIYWKSYELFFAFKFQIVRFLVARLIV